jgi:hypothetical protein
MAIRDPGARRVTLRYLKGSVSGCKGLIEHLFGASAVGGAVTVVTGSDGRRRLKNTVRRSAAASGRPLLMGLPDGKTYRVHIRGSLVDFATNGAPRLISGRVEWYATPRGTRVYL